MNDALLRFQNTVCPEISLDSDDLTEKLINGLRSEYCNLFYKMLDGNNSWCITNYKKDDILKILDELISSSDGIEKSMFIDSRRWIIEGFEKGEKRYLKNSYEIIFHARYKEKHQTK